MKVLYFVDYNNKRLPAKDIEEALKNLKNEVEVIDSQSFEMKELIEKANKSDLFLFHRGGVITEDKLNFTLSLHRLDVILNAVKCKKVMWFLDKVWELNKEIADTIVPLTDYSFFNDGNWVRKNKYPNASTLHCGAGQKRPLGKKDKELEADVALVGQVYGPREDFKNELAEIFGDRFIHVDNCFGKDFDNLCQSAKIIIEPSYPLEDFYWTDRIYKTLASGGLFLGRELYGRKEFEPNKEYITYDGMSDLAYKLKHFVRDEAAEERKVIQRRGREKVYKKSTYKHRLKEIFNKIKK